MADSIKTARGDDQYMLRLPAGMRDEIKASADANGRSMNAEIVARLTSHHSLRDQFAGLALAGIVERMNPSGDFPTEEIAARLSYRYADAMMAERGRT